VEAVSNFNIALAGVSDIAEIMSFIDNHWKKDHILARDELFFRYEHQYNDSINFVVARNSNHAINAVLGFIPTALNEKVTDVCTVIWKVETKNTIPGLGIQMLQYLKTITLVRTLLSVGINEKTINIYHFLNMFTGTLTQYVMINPHKKDFVIAKVPKVRETKELYNSDGYKLEKIEDVAGIYKFNFNAFNHCIPFKNQAYFSKRYFQHPIYNYHTYGIFFEKELKGLLITRIQECNGAEVLRIVDFFGEQDHLMHVAKSINDLVSNNNFEYADFYCYGIDRSLMLKAGFMYVNPDSEEVIIPNYFSPFLQKNIPIHFFADTSDTKRLRICKADGDQDRPS
jgi:uncharacterized protein YegP (UPF0339 family)